MNLKSSKFNILQKNILHNTLSNNLIIIDDKSILKKVQSHLLESKVIHNEFSEKEVQILLDGEFLINANVDEDLLAMNTFKKTFYNPKKVNLIYLPTLKCNLSCEYCFQNSLKIKENINNIDLKDFFKEYLKGVEELNIALFGGEPLLFENRIFDLLKVLKQYKEKIKITFTITTNGTLITKNIIEAIEKDYKLNTIQVTLDGTKERHDSVRIGVKNDKTFDLILNNLLILKSKKQISVIVRINLLNETEFEIEKTLFDLKNLKMKNLKIYFRKIYSTSTYSVVNNVEIEKFYSLALKHNLDIFISDTGFCETTGHEKNIFLTYDLKMYKCLNEMHPVEEVGFFTKDKKISYNSKIKKWLGIESNLTKKCYNCKYLPKCFGGCKAVKLGLGKNNCFHEKDFDFDLKYKE